MSTTARALVAAAGAAVALAGSAHADSNDDLYIAALNHVGAGTSRAPREALIHLGHTVCSDLRSGTSADSEMKGMFATANLTVDQAAMLVVAAIDCYCPQYKYELDEVH